MLGERIAYRPNFEVWNEICLPNSLSKIEILVSSIISVAKFNYLELIRPCYGQKFFLNDYRSNKDFKFFKCKPGGQILF